MDLAAYLARIEHSGGVSPDLATLRGLHFKHPVAIPFENLSTLIGEPILLDSAALEAKLVKRRRGGYCFEQNALFAKVLKSLGFRVTTLCARVVWNQSGAYTNPRTHMVLLVDLDDRYLCDVGFGGLTLTGPLRFVVGLEQETPHEVFRLTERDHEFELQARVEGDWRPLYRFDLQEQLPVDYEVLNHFVATYPASHFRTHLMAGRPTLEGRYALSNNQLTVYRRGRAKEQQILKSASAIESALREHFRIELPVDRALDAALRRLSRL